MNRWAKLRKVVHTKRIPVECVQSLDFFQCSSKADEADSDFVFESFQIPFVEKPIILRLRSAARSFSLNEFQDSDGVDNTGNVRVWNSESALAHLLVSRRERVLGKRVVELGAGMAGLAGLVAAAYGAQFSLITDGNERCVCSLQHNILLNSHVARPPSSYESSQSEQKSVCCVQQNALSGALLKWEKDALTRLPQEWIHSFDLIVVSDCLFFRDYHDALLCTLDALLTSDKSAGQIWIVGPRRGGTLDAFVEKAKQYSSAQSSAALSDVKLDAAFCCELIEHWDAEVDFKCARFHDFCEDRDRPLLLSMKRI